MADQPLGKNAPTVKLRLKGVDPTTPRRQGSCDGCRVNNASALMVSGKQLCSGCIPRAARRGDAVQTYKLLSR